MSEIVKVLSTMEAHEEADVCGLCHGEVPPHSKHECVQEMTLVRTNRYYRGHIVAEPAGALERPEE